MTETLRCWLFCSIAMIGCTSTTANDSMGVHLGDFSMVFDDESSTLNMNGEDELLLQFPLCGFELGLVDEVSDDFNYDPWNLVSDDFGGNQRPAGLYWSRPTVTDSMESQDRTMKFILSYRDRITASLKISAESEGIFKFELTPENAPDRVAYFRICPNVQSREAFYGLGGTLDRIEHRASTRAMQMELDMDVESGYNEAHVPIPLLTSTLGWGLFIDSFYPSLFDLADTDPDKVCVSIGTGTASSKGLTFYLLAASHALDITGRYYQVTGAPNMPAPWALGPWLWRDENRDQAQVLSDAQIMRELDLPSTAMWIDRPYASGVNSFDFDPAMFDDPQAMIDQLHSLGFRLALWHTPYVDKSDDATSDLYNEARDNAYFPPKTGLILNNWSAPIDLTNPDAYSWWQGLIGRYSAMGVEGYKLDYAEDVVPGLLGARNKWEFFDGSDERTMQHRYQILYHQVYSETLPDSGGFLLCRTGASGDQKNVSVIWPGDLDANLAEHKETVTDRNGETYVAVGGLPASVKYALGLGVSGFAFFASDTGGYRHSPPDKEIFTRWFEQTALSPVMQIGTSSNDVAWEFTEENGFDEQMLDWYRRYTSLHLRLWPYLWTLAKNLPLDGRPIMRPIGLAYPDMGQHPDDQYLLGDNLLVAPVMSYGARQKNVILPPGNWIYWWDGSQHQGPGEENMDVPLDTLPLFLRQGAMIPMLRPEIETISTSDYPEEVDSYSNSPGILYVRTAPGPASSFQLFDGSTLEQEQQDETINLSFHPGQDFTSGVRFELISGLSSRPKSILSDTSDLALAESMQELDSMESGWFYDPAAQVKLIVKLGPGVHNIQISM